MIYKYPIRLVTVKDDIPAKYKLIISNIVRPNAPACGKAL